MKVKIILKDEKLKEEITEKIKKEKEKGNIWVCKWCGCKNIDLSKGMCEACWTFGFTNFEYSTPLDRFKKWLEERGLYYHFFTTGTGTKFIAIDDKTHKITFKDIVLLNDGKLYKLYFCENCREHNWEEMDY